MAVGRGQLVDGAPKVERLHDAVWSEVEHLGHRLGDLVLGYHGRALGVHHDRDRVNDADRIGDLHLHLLGQAGSDDVLGDVSAHVSCRTVDLGGVLT